MVTTAPRDQILAIEQAARDYYEGWFEGDAERMAKCLHPRLAKRNIDQPDRADSPVDENSWESMVSTFYTSDASEIDGASSTSSGSLGPSGSSRATVVIGGFWLGVQQEFEALTSDRGKFRTRWRHVHCSLPIPF